MHKKGRFGGEYRTPSNVTVKISIFNVLRLIIVGVSQCREYPSKFDTSVITKHVTNIMQCIHNSQQCKYPTWFYSRCKSVVYSGMNSLKFLH